MRLYSTAESVDKGEISLLAIVETILATAVAIYLAVTFNSLRWIAWSACIAPFLLLRTEQSTALGIKRLDEHVQWIEDKRENWRKREESLQSFWALFISKISRIMFPICSIGVMAVLIRLTAIVATVCRHPITSFSSIPANWVRATLSVDTRCPPEIVPGYHLAGTKGLTPSGLLRNAKEEFSDPDLAYRVLIAFIFTAYFIVSYVPPLLYRWSMKATAIVYTPFLWLAWATFRKMPDISAALKRIRESDLTRVVVIYSILVITGFAVKFILMIKWSNFAAWWNTTPLTDFLAIYVAPAEIPLWQLTALINAFWAIAVFVFVYEARLRIEAGEPWSTKAVESFLRVSSFGRCLLSLYTITCTGYLTVQAAKTWNLPVIGTRLFPW